MLSPYEIGYQLALKNANYAGDKNKSPMQMLDRIKRKTQDLTGIENIPIDDGVSTGSALRRKGLPRDMPSSINASEI